MAVIKLVKPEEPKANELLVETLEQLLQEAKSGYLSAFAGVKFNHAGQFGTIKIGSLSDIEVLVALSFTQFDIINGNVPTEKK